MRDDYSQDVKFLVVNNFETINIIYTNEFEIIINSKIKYTIFCNGDSKKYVQSLLKSEVRDKKIEQILE